jgi:hypothetical protein
VIAVVGALGLAGCGSDSSTQESDKEKAAEGSFSPGEDAQTCSADATALDTPYAESFPTDWPFPPKTVVYDAEDRGDAGTVVTAISAASFKDILDYMNNDVVDAGFEIESGETEEHDAEAEWRGTDFHGRWAIRVSSACPGETSIQVLAGAN